MMVLHRPSIGYMIISLFVILNQGDCNKNNNSTKELIVLLSLANTTCDEINWCSIKSQLEFNSNGGCCSPCSCQQDCYVTLNCCPDKRISEIYKGDKFENVDNYISFLNDLELNSTIRESLNWKHFTSFKSNENSNRNMTKCIYSSALGLLPNRPKVPSYEMIAKCSKPAENPEITEKCENMSSVITHEYLKDAVPIQSRRTKLVYRNRFCFECSSEAGSEFDPWEIYFTNSNTFPHLIYYHVQSIDVLVYGIFNDINERPWSQENLVFKPMKSSSDGINTCHYVDVDSCDNTLSNSSLSDTCTSYLDPVYAYVDGQSKAFKNLACLTCYQNEKNEKGGCQQFPQHINSQIEAKLNLDKAMNEDMNSTLNFGRNEFLSTEFSPACQNGFIYDSYKDVCRQVLCPCGMVVKYGKCQPIFLNLKVKNIVAYFTIRIDKDFTSLDERAEMEYRIKHEFNKTFKTIHFQKQLVLLYRSKRSSKLAAEYLVIVMFSNENLTTPFYELLKTVNAYQGEKIVELSSNSFILQISVSSSNIEYKYDHVVDLSRNKEYKLIDDKAEYDLDSPALDDVQRAFIIGECSFCYRVELMNDDYFQVGRLPLVQLYRNQKRFTLTRETRMYMENKRFVSCISLFDYFRSKTTPKSADTVRIFNISSIDPALNNNSKEDEKGMVIILIALVGLLLAILATANRKYRRAQKRKPQRHTLSESHRNETREEEKSDKETPL